MQKTPDDGNPIERELRDFAEDRRDWMRHVLADGKIPANYRLIAIAIALRINHRSEEAWPSTKRIAEDTATSLRTVIRAVAFLEHTKLLAVTHRKRGVNRYEMLYPWR